MLLSMHDLQRLRDEFDIANAARHELDVVAALGCAGVVLDLVAHGADRVERRVRKGRIEDQLVEIGEEPGAQLEIPRDRARLQQGLKLPGPSAVLIICLLYT